MTTRYIIQGFKRPENRDSKPPGSFFKMDFEYPHDAEAIYKKIAPLFKDYELEFYARVETTKHEIIAGNSAFVKDCKTWGKTGPHAEMIAPANAGHKRIMAGKKAPR